MAKKSLFQDANIFKTKFFNVRQDCEVPIAGFFIIAPLRKMESIADFSDEEAIDFINLIRKLRHGMEKNLNIKVVYLFQNEDTDHGFHLWIFPRHGWMEKFGRKIQSVRPIMDYAKENMLSNENFEEVGDYVKRMKKYMT